MKKISTLLLFLISFSAVSQEVVSCKNINGLTLTSGKKAIVIGEYDLVSLVKQQRFDSSCVISEYRGYVRSYQDSLLVFEKDYASVSTYIYNKIVSSKYENYYNNGLVEAIHLKDIIALKIEKTNALFPVGGVFLGLSAAAFFGAAPVAGIKQSEAYKYILLGSAAAATVGGLILMSSKSNGEYLLVAPSQISNYRISKRNRKKPKVWQLGTNLETSN